MYKIGLTGGIASGKSTVLSWLREKGVTSIDADQVARDVVEPGTEGLSALVKAFSPSILTHKGELNRPALGEIVFSNQEALQRINDTLHPFIRRRMQELARTYETEGIPCIIYDIPLLFESDWHKEMDEIWLVYVTPQVQVERLMERNGYTYEDAMKRIHSQMPLDEKKAKSQVIIDNSGTLEDLEDILQTIWDDKKHLF